MWVSQLHIAILHNNLVCYSPPELALSLIYTTTLKRIHFSPTDSLNLWLALSYSIISDKIGYTTIKNYNILFVPMASHTPIIKTWASDKLWCLLPYIWIALTSVWLIKHMHCPIKKGLPLSSIAFSRSNPSMGESNAMVVFCSPKQGFFCMLWWFVNAIWKWFLVSLKHRYCLR